MISAQVSWRYEPGINRAYVWLSDGSIAGYRDLDTGTDHLTEPRHRDLLNAALRDWVGSTGVPGVAAPQAPEPPAMDDVRGWLRRRRVRRAHGQALASYQSWRSDHPLWRVPIDPPHGGWVDLVRNDPGRSLWEHLGALPIPAWYALGAKREARAWREGARGEETVGEELIEIARRWGWRYVHSVPVGSRGSDIDHVLVGAGGASRSTPKLTEDRTSGLARTHSW